MLGFSCDPDDDEVVREFCKTYVRCISTVEQDDNKPSATLSASASKFMHKQANGPTQMNPVCMISIQCNLNRGSGLLGVGN